MINVAYCTDENYAIPTMVSIVSLVENMNLKSLCAHRGGVTIYVLTDYISNENRSRFERLEATLKVNIEIVEISKKNKFHGLKTVERYFPSSMYYRFLLPEILCNEDRVLYLDCDTMIRKDISALYHTELTGLACGAVVDQNCDSVSIQNRLRKEKNFEYYNSGVLLMNLEYWRENRITSNLIDLVREYSDDLIFPDQDVLNTLLNDKIFRLD